MPAISIVANVHNEEKNVRNFIESLLAQDFKDFELILVDDGSTDRTLQIAEGYKEQLLITILCLEHVGLKKARAKGIEMVQSDKFLVIDVDIIIDNTCVGKFFNAFDSPNIGAVTGMCLSAGDSWIAKGSSVVAEGAYLALKNRDGTKDLASGGLSAYRTQPIREIGGFALENVAADLEISWRLQRNGWKIIARDDIIGYHRDPDTVTGIFKWGYTRGQMGFHTRWQYKDKLVQWQHLVRFGPTAIIVATLLNRWLGLISLVLSFVLFQANILKVRASVLNKTYAYIVFMVKSFGWSIGFLVELTRLLKRQANWTRRWTY